MRKLYATAFFDVMLLIALPFPELFACGNGTPLYTHFVYIFGHANILHWLINAWALLVLHNLIRSHRILFAYSAAVATSFIPIGLLGSFASSAPLPIIGLSTITSFLIGFASLHFYHTKRIVFYQTLLILIIGLFMPHIAGWQHVIMFILGILYFKSEMIIRNILAYGKD